VLTLLQWKQQFQELKELLRPESFGGLGFSEDDFFNEPTRIVCLHFLSQETSEQDVVDCCSKFGDIHEVILAKPRPGIDDAGDQNFSSHREFGYIRFKNSDPVTVRDSMTFVRSLPNAIFLMSNVIFAVAGGKSFGIICV